jgi:hypothetical protein
MQIGSRRLFMFGGLLAVVIAFAWVGCSDDDPKADPPESSSTTTTSEPSTTTTDPTEAIGREAAEAYERWEGQVRRLYEQPDPQSRLLDELYTGSMRESARQYLEELKARGVTSPPRPGDVSKWKALNVEVRSPTEALVSYCYLDGRWTLDASGVVMDDKVATREGKVLFVKGEDGVWRSSSFEGGSRQEGVAGCAEQL